MFGLVSSNDRYVQWDGMFGVVFMTRCREDGLPGRCLGYVVNNHGDRCCPLKINFGDPFPMAELHGLQMGGGEPNHLQVLG